MDEQGDTHTLVITERLTVLQREYVFAVNPENSDEVALLKVYLSPEGRVLYGNITDDDEWAELEASLGVQ